MQWLPSRDWVKRGTQALDWSAAGPESQTLGVWASRKAHLSRHTSASTQNQHCGRFRVKSRAQCDVTEWRGRGRGGWLCSTTWLSSSRHTQSIIQQFDRWNVYSQFNRVHGPAGHTALEYKGRPQRHRRHLASVKPNHYWLAVWNRQIANFDNFVAAAIYACYVFF